MVFSIPLPKWGDEKGGFSSKVLMPKPTRDEKTHERDYTITDVH
jgi:hypothetical protein